MEADACGSLQDYREIGPHEAHPSQPQEQKVVMVASLARTVGLVIAVTSIFVADTALAVGPVFGMGDPTFFGSGCPANTVKITTSRGDQSVSIRFSELNATTTSNVNRDCKSCNLAVDFRCNAFVPPVAEAYTEFQANYFYSNEELLLSNKLGVSAVIWSPCGQFTNLCINTSLIVYKPKLSDADPVITIDTTDVSIERGFRFYVTHKTCVATSQPTNKA